jgi:hypothetical protein
VRSSFSSSLRLLRDFPNVSLTLSQLTVVGVKPFDRDTLLAMQRTSPALDLRSVVRYLRNGQPIIVHGLAFEQQQAARAVREADARADAIVAQAKQKADAPASQPT